MAVLDLLTGWDYVVGVVAILSFGIGLFRGMIRTVSDLGSWVVAFLAAPMLGPRLTDQIQLQAYPWVALIIVFVLVFFLVRLIGVWLARGVDGAGLAGADRALGGLAGLARAALLVAALASAGKLLDMHRQPAWENALSRPALDAAAKAVDAYFPDLQKLKPAARRVSG